MELSDLFDPVSIEKPAVRFLPLKSSLGGNIKIHTPDNPVGSVQKYDIALLGVGEDRNSDNKGAATAPDMVRSQLYQLTKLSPNLKIIDLGNLKQGRRVQDTYFGLRDTITFLIEMGVFPIVIGGTQDLTIGIYQAIEKINNRINLVTIDSRLDFKRPVRDFNSLCYLNRILLKGAEKLFHYVNLGHQIYNVSSENLKYLKNNYFESIRLGQLRSNIKAMEPYLRDANIVSMDISAVKQTDAPGYFQPSPNGLYSEEVCQIAKYAGSGSQLQAFGLFETNPKFDNNDNTALLAAQIIWYFMDGFSIKRAEFPDRQSEDFTKFIVNLSELNNDIVFYKHNHTDLWWMEIPLQEPSNKRRLIIACSHEDYQAASNQEIPDRWLKIYRKLN